MIKCQQLLAFFLTFTSMIKIILLIHVKMQTIVGILTINNYMHDFNNYMHDAYTICEFEIKKSGDDKLVH